MQFKNGKAPELKRLEVKFFEVSVKADENDDGCYTIEGYASTFGNVDLGDDVVEKGAFTASLVKRMPKMLWQHDRFTPIGAWVEARETEKGLWVKGKMPKGNSNSKNAAELAKIGALGGMSIGYSVPKDGFDIIDGIRHLKVVDCFEASLVTFPMNQMAEIASCKEVDALVDMKDVNEFLKAKGFTNAERTALVSKVKQISLAEGKPEAGAPEQVAPPVQVVAQDEVQPELAAEIKRLQGNLADLK